MIRHRASRSPPSPYTLLYLGQGHDKRLKRAAYERKGGGKKPASDITDSSEKSRQPAGQQERICPLKFQVGKKKNNSF